MKARHGYASVLEWGSRIGLVLAVAAFLIYIAGILPSTVKVGDIDKYWGLPLEEYIAATGTPTGPGAWLTLLGTGDGLAALPAILFSVLSLVAYLAIAIPTILDRDHAYTVFIILETALIGATVFGIIGG